MGKAQKFEGKYKSVFSIKEVGYWNWTETTLVHFALVVCPGQNHQGLIQTEGPICLMEWGMLTYYWILCSSLVFLRSCLSDTVIFHLVFNTAMMKMGIRLAGWEDGEPQDWKPLEEGISAAGRAECRHESHFKSALRGVWYAKRGCVKWLSWQAVIVPANKERFKELFRKKQKQSKNTHTGIPLNSNSYIQFYRLQTGRSAGQAAPFTHRR